jgi:hypothetical protein
MIQLKEWTGSAMLYDNDGITSPGKTFPGIEGNPISDYLIKGDYILCRIKPVKSPVRSYPYNTMRKFTQREDFGEKGLTVILSGRNDQYELSGMPVKLI